MAHQVAWTKDILEAFIDMALLSEDEEFVMRTRCKSWTITRQAQYLNCSESTVHNMIRNLKQKYDKVQKEHPELFPERKFSAEEVYMDHH